MRDIVERYLKSKGYEKYPASKSLSSWLFQKRINTRNDQTNDVGYAFLNVHEYHIPDATNTAYMFDMVFTTKPGYTFKAEFYNLSPSDITDKLVYFERSLKSSFDNLEGIVTLRQ